mmetsp:Transcript_28609/g.98731  ORF Transcript_28609/g.98731 Transcript_28609/m.98731 type:complete len:224 (-) Transcript_28609:195-866(-)
MIAHAGHKRVVLVVHVLQPQQRRRRCPRRVSGADVVLRDAARYVVELVLVLEPEDVCSRVQRDALQRLDVLVLEAQEERKQVADDAHGAALFLLGRDDVLSIVALVLRVGGVHVCKVVGHDVREAQVRVRVEELDDALEPLLAVVPGCDVHVLVDCSVGVELRRHEVHENGELTRVAKLARARGQELERREERPRVRALAAAARHHLQELLVELLHRQVRAEL